MNVSDLSECTAQDWKYLRGERERVDMCQITVFQFGIILCWGVRESSYLLFRQAN
jgi:hypothetical protein